MTALGTRLMTIRMERGLRRSELARLAEISPSSVYLLEEGKRAGQASTVQKLAKALGVPAGLLLSDDEAEREEAAYYSIADMARLEGMTPRELAMCVRWYLEARETFNRKEEVASWG